MLHWIFKLIILKFHHSDKPSKLLSSFSVYTKSNQLFDVAKSKNSLDIRCLHGIRSLAILHIILGHRHGSQLWENFVSNANFANEWSQQLSILTGVYQNYIASVDTFLLLGALLATMSMLRNLEKWVHSWNQIICISY